MERYISGPAAAVILFLLVTASALASPLPNRAPAVRTGCGAVRKDCIRTCKDLRGGDRIEKEKTVECVNRCADQYDACMAQRDR